MTVIGWCEKHKNSYWRKLIQINYIFSTFLYVRMFYNFILDNLHKSAYIPTRWKNLRMRRLVFILIFCAKNALKASSWNNAKARKIVQPCLLEKFLLFLAICICSTLRHEGRQDVLNFLKNFPNNFPRMRECFIIYQKYVRHILSWRIGARLQNSSRQGEKAHINTREDAIQLKI